MTQEPPIKVTQESSEGSTKRQFQIYDSSLKIEKIKIKERLHIFQELFDGSPLIQEIRKVSHDQGLREGIQQVIEYLYKYRVREERWKHFNW